MWLVSTEERQLFKDCGAHLVGEGTVRIELKGRMRITLKFAVEGDLDLKEIRRMGNTEGQ